MKWPVLISVRMVASRRAVARAAPTGCASDASDSLLKITPPWLPVGYEPAAPKFQSKLDPLLGAQHALGGEGYRHRRAEPALRVDRELGAMQLGEGLGERQAEAGAGAFARLP